MNKHIAISLYFALWAAVTAAVIYAVTAAGNSLWLASALAALFFFFVNGSFAYVFRARQLRREGKQPPPYLLYLFFPKGISCKVAVTRPVRVILGIVVSLGGVFLMASGLLLTDPDPSPMPHPFSAVAIFLVLVAVGGFFAYIGFRLIVIQNDEALFRCRQTTGSSNDNAA